MEIEVDEKGVARQFKVVESKAKTSGKKAGKEYSDGFSGKVGDGLKNLSSRALAFGATFLAALGVREVVNAAARQEEAIKKLEASLRAAGQFSRQTSKDLQDFASELQRITVFGDEAVIEQLAFAQAMGASAQQSKQILSAATDMSAALNIDLNAAVRNISKTLGGFAGELGEVIPELKNLTKTQLQAGEGVTLLADKYRGFAQAEKSTFSGSVKSLSNNFGDLLETLGETITKSDLMKEAIQGISESIQTINATLRGPELTIDQDIERTTKAFVELQQTLARVKSAQGNRGFLEQIIGVGSDKEIAEMETRLGVLSARLQELGDLKNEQAQKKELSIVPKPTEEEIEAQKKFHEFLRREQESTTLSAEQFKIAMADPEFKEAVMTQNDAITTDFSNFASQLQLQAAKIKVTNAQIAKSFITTFSNGVGGAMAAFGAALASGEDPMKAFAKAMFQMIGDVAIQLGTSFIMQGIAHSLNPLTPGLGGPLIAAGAALAAFGGAVKVLAGGGGATTGGGTSSSGGVGSFGTDTEFAASGLSSDDLQNQEPKTQIAVNIQGDVLDSQESSLRIVQLLNSAFDEQGVEVRNV